MNICNNKKRNRQVKILTILLVFLSILLYFIYSDMKSYLPSELTIINGKEYSCNFKIPSFINLNADNKNGNIKINRTKAKEMFFDNITLLSNYNKDTIINVNMNIFGYLPIKTMMLEAISDKKLIPCGNAIGVRLYTEGVLIVAFQKLRGTDGQYYEPYKNSNIKVGDYVTGINNKPIKNIEGVSKNMEKCNGKQVTITLKRDKNIINTTVTPCEVSKNVYKIGIWLRDSTAGIGTITFYDEETNMYGALGHGITDVDSGALMKIDRGNIIPASIVGIDKGNRGTPGELKGILLEQNGYGSIIQNTECGIYGTINKKNGIIPNIKAIPISLSNEIKEGSALILSNIDGKTINAYDISIIRVFRDSQNSTKNILIKITDKRLLETTGGIVQGMSGSPIIQNGHLIGAVTHVLVNDPQKGYGIFIENMLRKSIKIKESNALKPAI